MFGRRFLWRREQKGLRARSYHVELALAALHQRRSGLDPLIYGAVRA